MTTAATAPALTAPARSASAGLAIPAALVAAAASAVGGVLQAIRPDHILHIDGAMHVIMAMMAVVLLTQGVALAPLAQRTAGRWAHRAVVAGSLVLAAAATASNVNGADFAWFPYAAAPANLAWLVGLVALAVSSWRARVVPGWLAAVLPVTWAGSIVLSPMGGGVAVALVWVALAVHLARR